MPRYANKTHNMLVLLAPVALSILYVKRQEVRGGGGGSGGGERGRAIPEHSDLTFSGIYLQANIATMGLIFLGFDGGGSFLKQPFN